MAAAEAERAPRAHEAVAGGVRPVAVAREGRRGSRLGPELLGPAPVVAVTGPEPADSWR